MFVNPRSISVNAEGIIIIERCIMFGFCQFLIVHDFSYEGGRPLWWDRVRFDHLEGSGIVWEHSYKVFNGSDEDVAS